MSYRQRDKLVPYVRHAETGEPEGGHGFLGVGVLNRKRDAAGMSLALEFPRGEIMGVCVADGMFGTFIFRQLLLRPEANVHPFMQLPPKFATMFWRILFVRPRYPLIRPLQFSHSVNF